MTRVIHLDEHVSRVQASVLELLSNTNCNLLLLSDVQVAVLEQMTFPYVRWPTRLVYDAGQYQQLVDFPPAYQDELDCLELLLSGGNTMACDLSVVLTALADAIRNQPTGSGGCNYSGPSAVLNCLPGITPGELIPQTPTAAPPYGVPPAGFDTWAEYLTHKCKAAYAIYDTVYGLFGALSGLPILQLSVTVIGIALGGYIAATAFGVAAFPPAAIIAIAAAALAIGLLDAQAYVQFRAIQSYLEAHKDEIICALYQSGSASEALAGLAANVEDAIQSVAWGAIFGGIIGPELAAAVGAMAGQAETNNLVNPLFQVIEDFGYPEVSCSGCGGTFGMGWHFDDDEEGWTWTSHENGGDDIYGAWSDAFEPEDPEDTSAGCLTAHIDQLLPIGDVYVDWEYIFAPDQRPVVQLGDGFLVDCYLDAAANAGYSLFIFYDDESYSTISVPNVTGWIRPGLDGTIGKTVSRLLVMFAVGETTDPRNFALDNVWWGQY